MDVDLAALLKLHKALSLEHCRYFGSQLLRALVHVNQSGIMHRDLKPSNIVVNAECDLKVIDFGLARVLDGDEMTEYVVTRYYRAPELLLESSNYTPAIDIWSVGCIILEMAAGCVLIPGNDIRDQVISILKTTGKPAPEKIEKISSERARDFVRSQPDSPPLDLEAFVAREREKRGVAQEDFGPILDLARKLLQFSAEDRLTAAEALEVCLQWIEVAIDLSIIQQTNSTSVGRLKATKTRWLRRKRRKRRKAAAATPPTVPPAARAARRCCRRRARRRCSKSTWSGRPSRSCEICCRAWWASTRRRRRSWRV